MSYFLNLCVFQVTFLFSFIKSRPLTIRSHVPSTVEPGKQGLTSTLGCSQLDHVAFLQSVSWILAEFYFNRGLQRLYTGTCIILQKTINGFLCLLIVFLKSKTYQLILKDVIKLNRNLP